MHAAEPEPRPVAQAGQATPASVPPATAPGVASAPVAASKAPVMVPIAAPAKPTAASTVAAAAAPNTAQAPAVVPAPAPQTATLSLAPQGNGNGGTGIDSALIGHLYSGTVVAAGYTVPLPDGKWALLANGRLTRKSGPPGVIYYLGKIEHKKLMGAAIIYALKDPGATIDANTYSVSPGCARKSASYLVKTSHDGDNALPNNCWYVDQYFAGEMQHWADKGYHMDNLVRAAAGDLAAKGVELPQDLPFVRYLFAEKTGLLYAEFKFNPEADGITSPIVPDFLDSDWAPANIGRHPEKVAYQVKLKAWGESFYLRMRDAFTNGLPMAAASPATPASAP